MRVIFTAAHAGAGPGVPIGGGGAVARMLEAHWRTAQPFELVVERPLEDSPEAIVRYTEGEYTDFCYRFERQCTQRILAEDPAHCAVLVNDISEGPDFAMLARHGYRVFTIWHVDVLAFVARMYLKGVLPPALLARLTRPVENLLGRAARLVFAKQRACVAHSTGHFVMTEAMRQTILDCYPGTPAAKVHVTPWGASPIEGTGVRTESQKPVALMLSRISPEKGQHRVLAHDLPVEVRVAGGAAYMGGEAYLGRLRRMAGPNVRFIGHLSGQAKLDAFASADIYVFPSVSESYGLTLMEALSHGLPVVAWDHDGARAIVQPDFGILVRNEAELVAAITRLARDKDLRARMSTAARAYAQARPFSLAADQLASVITSTAR